MSFEITPEAHKEFRPPEEQLTEFMKIGFVSLDRIAARNTEILKSVGSPAVLEYLPNSCWFEVDGRNKGITHPSARLLGLLVQAPQAVHSREELESLLISKFLHTEANAPVMVTRGARVLDEAGLGVERVDISGRGRRFTSFELFNFVVKPKHLDTVPVSTVRPRYFCLSGAMIVNPRPLNKAS